MWSLPRVHRASTRSHAPQGRPAFATPELREAMTKQGNTINPGSPAEVAQFFRAELAKYARVVKTAGLTAK